MDVIVSFDIENAELVDEAFVHVRDGRRIGSGTRDRHWCRKEVENALKTVSEESMAVVGVSGSRRATRNAVCSDFATKADCSFEERALHGRP